MSRTEGIPGQDQPYPIIAGGSQELTSVAKFTVEHVGGTIAEQRLVSGEMVGGRMVGGQTVEVTGVLTDAAFLSVRSIIVDEINTSKNFVPIDKITDEARLIEDLGTDSLAAGNLGLRFEDEILEPGMLFPPQLSYVIGTVGHIRNVLNVMLLKESPLPGVELGEAKLQLLNAFMFERLGVARTRAKLRGEEFDDSHITEIKILSA